MSDRKTGYTLLCAGLIVLLSISALLVNYTVYQYPANNYFPPDVLFLLLILIFFYLGLLVFFGKNSRVSAAGLELLYFFGVMSLVALATNATQLTPFTPIDNKIIAFEHAVHIDMAAVVEWTHQHPYFKLLLSLLYDSLPYQMCVIPLLVLALGKFNLLRDYYLLLLITTLVGFTFYYFYPTTAPASVINSPFFSPYQRATGLKFQQLHQHINPYTIEGGLIALPSFHAIWALLCVYLVKQWRTIFFILLVINLALIASCVLLGWHYPSDVIAAAILVSLSYYFLITHSMASS